MKKFKSKQIVVLFITATIIEGLLFAGFLFAEFKNLGPHTIFGWVMSVCQFVGILFANSIPHFFDAAYENVPINVLFHVTIFSVQTLALICLLALIVKVCAFTKRS